MHSTASIRFNAKCAALSWQFTTSSKGKNKRKMCVYHQSSLGICHNSSRDTTKHLFFFFSHFTPATTRANSRRKVTADCVFLHSELFAFDVNIKSILRMEGTKRCKFDNHLGGWERLPKREKKTYLIGPYRSVAGQRLFNALSFSKHMSHSWRRKRNRLHSALTFGLLISVGFKHFRGLGKFVFLLISSAGLFPSPTLLSLQRRMSSISRSHYKYCSAQKLNIVVFVCVRAYEIAIDGKELEFTSDRKPNSQSTYTKLSADIKVNLYFLMFRGKKRRNLTAGCNSLLCGGHREIQIFILMSFSAPSRPLANLLSVLLLSVLTVHLQSNVMRQISEHNATHLQPYAHPNYPFEFISFARVIKMRFA